MARVQRAGNQTWGLARRVPFIISWTFPRPPGYTAWRNATVRAPRRENLHAQATLRAGNATGGPRPLWSLARRGARTSARAGPGGGHPESAAAPEGRDGAHRPATVLRLPQP